MELRQGTTHGWSEVTAARKRELIQAVLAGEPTAGPLHAELDLTDRCNVACYFCNQQDTRTALQIPAERATALIDELVDRGLASVRLSGGGDPLHHKQILAILDHLAARGVVLDNLTTNAVALTPAVADRLVDNGAREVNVSLNAADGDDYQRMMAVKPALFDRVLANVRHLVARRGAAPMPMVTLQFLLDRENAHRALEMDALARAQGCDRVVISAVQQIPLQRVEGDLLLYPEDADRLLPVFTELYRRHPGDERLEVNLEGRGLGPMLVEARRLAEAPAPVPFPTAATFRDTDGGCFFAWYSTAITGDGNVYPCCQLIRPEGPVLGNVMSRPFAEVWSDEPYRRLREEMRDVLVEGADREHPKERFRILPSVCHEPGLCWLKNVYFRADEDFYRELGEALAGERHRRTQVRRLRGAAGAVLARLPALAPAYHRLRDATRPARRWLKRRFGLGLTEAA
jgi:MoaA/NifB/PqqE/SkfB family radical SAM enzyme